MPTIEDSSTTVSTREKLRQRAYRAERNVVGIRLAIVALATLSLPFVPYELVPSRELAWVLLGIFWTYSLWVQLIQPRHAQQWLRSSLLNVVVDGVLLACWLVLTGGFESPYFGAWYVGVAGSAYRFRLRSVLGVSAFYAAMYVALCVATGTADGHWVDLVIRVSFLGLTAVASGLLAHEAIGAEADLMRAKEAAEAANRAKSAFLANMSHEIRTPLSALLGFTELLSDPEQPVEERKLCLDTIKRNGVALSALIDDILDLSKVEAGRLRVDLSEQVSVPELLEEVAQTFRKQAEQRGLVLRTTARGREPTIVTDPLRLRQVLVNLLGNAVKFTERGVVTVGAAGTGDSVEITVADTGTGISLEAQRQLFQPFFQADAASSRRFGGTGLGLALSRRLANALEGDLSLAWSDLGKGSCFRLTLPVLPSTARAARVLNQATQVTMLRERTLSGATKATPLPPPPAAAAPPAPAPPATAESPLPAPAAPPVRELPVLESGPLRGITVLLADDAPDNRALITRQLVRAGAHVETACDGEEAVQKALSRAADVVLMDLQMPRLDGIEATKRLRRLGYTFPIIALTAHAMREERDLSLAAGCDDHLTKPVNLGALVASIGRLAQSQRTQARAHAPQL